jgi:hypothetical protein
MCTGNRTAGSNPALSATKERFLRSEGNVVLRKKRRDSNRRFLGNPPVDPKHTMSGFAGSQGSAAGATTRSRLAKRDHPALSAIREKPRRSDGNVVLRKKAAGFEPEVPLEPTGRSRTHNERVCGSQGSAAGATARSRLAKRDHPARSAIKSVSCGATETSAPSHATGPAAPKEKEAGGPASDELS